MLEGANSAAFRKRKTERRGEFFARFGRNLKNLAKKRLARGVASTQTAYNNKDGVSLFRRRDLALDVNLERWRRLNGLGCLKVKI